MPSRYSESVDALDGSSFERLINLQSYTDEELKTLAARLTEEEREISMHRRLLHAELDIIQAETVRRLRDKNKTGGSLVQNGDISTLVDILSGRGYSEGQQGEE